MYNSYTSISYKSAAADLHRNLKPLQRMALLSRGFRLYHLHMLKATFWFFEPECSFFIFSPSMINWLTVCIMEGFLCFIM